MPGLIQRLLTPAPGSRVAISESNAHSRVLAVTADLAFYARVLNAASSVRWRTDWARTPNRAIEICRLKSTPIVIYDGNLPGAEWRRAFERLSGIAHQPRILLAATSIDEDLWTEVLDRHGYDVVSRSASSEELRRAFQFAWLSLLTPADI